MHSAEKRETSDDAGESGRDGGGALVADRRRATLNATPGDRHAAAVCLTFRQHTNTRTLECNVHRDEMRAEGNYF